MTAILFYNIVHFNHFSVPLFPDVLVIYRCIKNASSKIYAIYVEKIGRFCEKKLIKI
jgi:hypothetical protein